MLSGAFVLPLMHSLVILFVRAHPVDDSLQQRVQTATPPCHLGFGSISPSSSCLSTPPLATMGSDASGEKSTAMTVPCALTSVIVVRGM